MRNWSQRQYRPIGFAVISIILVALSGAVQATPDCKILQKGNESFSDAFADSTGGWQLGPEMTFGAPALTITLSDPNIYWVVVNGMFNATDGDYCMQAVLPEKPSTDNSGQVGLVTLYKDQYNWLMFVMNSTSDILIEQLVNNAWTPVGNPIMPGGPLAPGSVVTMRLKVKGTLITPSINGIELPKVRVQVPVGTLNFGVIVSSQKLVQKPGMKFQFSNYRVTSGE